MSDDVLINKAATIERCVARAREEYNANPQGWEYPKFCVRGLNGYPTMVG